MLLLFAVLVVLGVASLFNYGAALVELIRSYGPAMAKSVQEFFAARITVPYIHPAALVTLFCIAAAFARIILPMVKCGVAEGLAEPHWPRAALIALLVAAYGSIVVLYDKGAIAGKPWISALVQFYPVVAFVAMLVLAAAVVVYFRQQ